MSGEEQERFEDYLELETFIEALQAGRIAHPPQDMTPDQARAYHIAILFHSVFPKTHEPRPAFAAALQVLLEQELRQTAKKLLSPSPDGKRFQNRFPTVSRRSILTGSVAVAASLAIGAGIEHTLEQTRVGMRSPVAVPPSPSVQPSTLVPATTPSTWHFVTTLADLSENVLRFTTDTVIGYVLDMTDQKRNNSEDPAQASNQIIALSAACTHMGCIVQWHDADRHFHCPCHGAIFAENGMGIVAPGAKYFLLPLPRLETKVEQGNVYVRVPVKRYK